MVYLQAPLFAAFNAFNTNKIIAACQKTSMRLNAVPIQYAYKRPGLSELDVPVVYFFKLDGSHSLELLVMKNAFEREVCQRNSAIILLPFDNQEVALHSRGAGKCCREPTKKLP